MARFGKPAAAVLVMGAIIATLITLCTPRTTSRSSAVSAAQGRQPVIDSARVDVRVLVLDFDPTIPDSGSRPLHRAFGWNDPRTLAEAYAADVREASGGRMSYRVVDWRTIDGFPVKRDGFRYTPATYSACIRDRDTCYSPDGLDYEAVIREHGVAALVDSGKVDEVWLFGGPYFGYSESAMAGPGAFEINGEAFTNVASRRPFALMGFNTERGVAEMLHDLCHRIEATMTRVYGGWDAADLSTDWARFAANAHQSRGRAGVGSCHYPPNALADYDYENARPVESDADDWLRYPALTGARRPVSRETWGGPDYHRGYMRWWLTHLPKSAGTNDDGRLNDWWAYVVRFDDFVIRDPQRPRAENSP